MSETKAVATKKADLLPQETVLLLQSFMPDVYALLPADIAPEKFRAACWLELTSVRDLSECVRTSIQDAVVEAATQGLLPGRDCNFIPFKQRKYGQRKGLTCVTTYFGTIRVLERSGKVRRCFAYPVHEGDEYLFDNFADRPHHVPAVTLRRTPGKELFYYGAVMFKDGTCQFEVVPLEDLEAIKQRAPGHESGPWVTDAVMMKRKSCIKRVAKYVQLTDQQQQFLEEEESRQREDVPLARRQRNVLDLYGEDLDSESRNPTAYSRETGMPEGPDLFAKDEIEASEQGES